MKRTTILATVLATSAFGATAALAQNQYDINEDGYLDYSELSAAVGSDEALTLLGGDEQGVLDAAGYTGATVSDDDVNNLDEQRAAGIRAPVDDDVPEYRQADDPSEMVDDVFADDD